MIRAGLTGAGLTPGVVRCPVLLETKPLLHAGLSVSFLVGIPALAEAPRRHVASGRGRLLVVLPLRLPALRLLSRGLESYRRLCVQSYRRLRLSQLRLSQLLSGLLLLGCLARWSLRLQGLRLQGPARRRLSGPGLRSLRLAVDADG